jgi:NitT/TauT family transport system substrate-binding protein
MRIIPFLFAAVLSFPAAAMDVLHVGVPSQGFVFSPLVLGLDAGTFTRQGLDVQRQFFSGAAKLTQALTVGATDIVLSGATDTAYAVKGAPETMICAIAIRALNLGVIVGNDIHDVADLKGKRIGVTQTGTITYWLALELARVNGWGPNGITPVPVGGLSASQMAGLISGQAQAVIADTSLGLELERGNHGRLLMTADSYVPNFLTIAMFARNDLIAQRPDLVQHFVSGWLETISLLLREKGMAIASATKATGLPEQIISASYDLQKPQWSTDGKVTADELARLATAIEQIGLVSTHPDLSTVYDPRFLQ